MALKRGGGEPRSYRRSSGCKALSRACRRRVRLSFGSLGTNFFARRLHASENPMRRLGRPPLWISDGYGELAEIHFDSLSVFEITASSCMLSSKGTRSPAPRAAGRPASQ